MTDGPDTTVCLPAALADNVDRLAQGAGGHVPSSGVRASPSLIDQAAPAGRIMDASMRC